MQHSPQLPTHAADKAGAALRPHLLWVRVVCCVLERHLQRDSKAVKALRNLRQHERAAETASA
jgi:hypothetical protein